jgi:hypothetical protein
MAFERRRGQNEKNEKKKHVLQFEKTNFLYCSMLAEDPLALHFKDDLWSLRRCSNNILDHSKWRRIEKDLPKCSVISNLLQ